jgi:zinc/manganese transport system substrate-binding protein
MGRRPGDNPHLWYDPPTIPHVAEAIAATLSAADPAHAADYATNLKALLDSFKRIDARVADLRGKYKGVPVTATEPVFGLMAQAIGLSMRNERFQLAMMNDTEPTAHDLAEFERDLKQNRVKALIYNSQVSEPMTTRLRDLAMASKIPVVPVTETLPPGMHVQDWLLSELDALDKALGGAK